MYLDKIESKNYKKETKKAKIQEFFFHKIFCIFLLTQALLFGGGGGVKRPMGAQSFKMPQFSKK